MVKRPAVPLGGLEMLGRKGLTGVPALVTEAEAPPPAPFIWVATWGSGAPAPEAEVRGAGAGPAVEGGKEGGEGDVAVLEPVGVDGGGGDACRDGVEPEADGHRAGDNEIARAPADIGECDARAGGVERGPELPG